MTLCIVCSIIYITTQNAKEKGVVAVVSLVRKARLDAGMSIEEAAKALGIPAGYLSQIEKGQRQVSAERADQIASLYNKSRDDIFLPSRFAIREVDKKTTA